jgi:hypothetical protein
MFQGFNTFNLPRVPHGVHGQLVGIFIHCSPRTEWVLDGDRAQSIAWQEW